MADFLLTVCRLDKGLDEFLEHFDQETDAKRRSIVRGGKSISILYLVKVRILVQKINK